MDSRFDRQSFLGGHAQEVLARARVGIVGLGGGGSHIAQQLAHVGIGHFVLYDPDVIKDVNHNRVVGAREQEVYRQEKKVAIAQRLISGVSSMAVVEAFESEWQTNPEPLRRCDLIFGCVDGYAQRRELEACARRFLIPLIDIGLDVDPPIEEEPPRMHGQVILSMPGSACLRCLRFLTDAKLQKEAALYGAAGARPQVVWANGVLASLAIQIGIDLLTDWTRSLRSPVYLVYDANEGTVGSHPRIKAAPTQCAHYPLNEIGDPVFRKL